MNFTNLTKKNKNLSAALMQMAMMVSSFSASAASAAYYSGRRGGFGSGKSKSYLVDQSLGGVSTDLFRHTKAAFNPPAETEIAHADDLVIIRSTVKELLVVDQNIKDYRQFSSLLKPGVELVEIPQGIDGFAFLLNRLSQYQNLSAVHLFSHASAGELLLGNTLVDSKTLKSHPEFIQIINRSLNAGGDFMLYGCELGKGETGDGFLEIIKSNTHVDVAASDNLTGNKAFNGDWELEIQKGDIEAKPLANSIALKDFTEVLQNFSFDDDNSVTDPGEYGGGASSNVEVDESGSTANYKLIVDGLKKSVWVAPGGGYAALGEAPETRVTLSFVGGNTFNPSYISLRPFGGTVNFSISTDQPGSPVTQSVLGGNRATINLNSLPDNATKLYIAAVGDVGFQADLFSVTFNSITATSTSVSSITRATASPTKATTLNYTVTFANAVTGVSADDFTLTTTGIASGTIGTPTGSGTTWTVPVTSVSGDGTLRLDFTNTTGITPNASGAYSAGQAYTVDNTVPVPPSQPDLTSGSDSGSSVSDNITNDTTPTFVGTAESGSTVTLYDTDGTTVLGTGTAIGGNWSITTSVLSSGNHTITAKAADAAGNTSAASSGLAITIDIAAPTATIVVADAVLSAGETSLVTVTFSEAVTGFTNADLTIANGTLSAVSSSDGGITWTATFTPTANITNASNLITLDNAGTADIAGNAGSGTTNSNNYAIDSTIPTIIAGLGTAINFERSRNEGIQVADHSTLNLGTGSFTIESWVKRSSGSGFFTILGKQTGSGSGVFLRFNDDKLSFAAGNYPASTDVSSVSSISDNNWHHIAAVMDASGKTMKIYIDGVLDASNAFTTNYTISSTAALGIGFKPNFGEYFDGSMDDVRFWSTARTAAQIKEYMHTPLAGTESGLVAYWNFEEGSGTSIDDRSSNANTGTLQNSDSDEFVTGNSTYSENVNDSYISLRLGGSDLDDQASATAVITALPANGKIYQTNDGYAKGTQITAVSTQLTDNGGNPRRVIYEPNLSFNGSDSFSFKVNDGTNTSSNTQVVNLTVLADTQAPTVTSVNSSTANGSYKTGDVISIQVNFNEAVTVTGTPQLTLESGTTDRVINYASGSGSSTLTFNYTIQAGDNSSDLDYNSTGALALNGGTIKDAAGNDGTLTLASPGATNSLGANKAIVVDGIVPVVSSVSSSSNNAGYKAGNVISIQVSFSEAVTVTGTPQLTLETGTTDRIVNYWSGSGTSSLTFRYTIQSGDSSSDLDYTGTGALALNSGTIQDAVGNAATLTLPTPGAANSLGANKAIVIDAIVPTVSSVSSSTANGTYKTGDAISIQVNLSEAVTVTGTPQLTLETGLTDQVINYVSGSGTSVLTFNYTVQAGDSSADLDYTGTNALALNGGVIRDAVSNNATLTLPSPGEVSSLGNSKSIVIDGVSPSVSSVGVPANATYITGNNLDFTVNFDENVTVNTGDGTPRIALTLNTGGTAYADYISGSGTSALVFRYTVGAGTADGDGITVGTLALNGGTLKDAAGNNATLTLNSVASTTNVLVEGILPTVSSINRVTSATTNATSLDFSVTYSEDVTGVDVTDFSITSTGTADASVSSVTQVNASTYTITVNTVSGSGTIRLDLKGSGTGIQDIAGNTIATGYTSGQTYTIDQIAPTVMSVSVPANGTYLAGSNLDFTVNFGENITVNTGGGTPRIALTLNTGGTVYADYISGSGTSALVFRYTVGAGTADGDGITVGTLALNGGTLKDAAGNNATLTLNSVASTASVLVEGTLPTVSSINRVTSATTNATSLDFSVTYSEDVTGVDVNDFSITSTGTADASVSSISQVNASTYTVTVNTVSGSGTIRIDLKGSGTGIQDIAGNAIATGYTSGQTYTIDQIAPTVMSVSEPANGTYLAGNNLDFTVNFGENITVNTGGGTPRIALTLNTGGTAYADYISGSGTSALVFRYTVGAGTADNDGITVGTLAANGGTLKDAAGNNATLTLNSAGSTAGVLIDAAVPTASIVFSDTALKIGETSLVTITFSEAVTGFTNADLTIANGTLSAVSSGDGGITWTATFTPTASVTEATNVITLDNTGVTDAAGNTGSGTTNSNNYAIDTNRPTASIVVADAALSAGETSLITFTFSEAVTGFANADLTIANGTLSAVSSGDGGITWTATFTPTASVTDATNVITLDNTGVTDAAGNAGSGTTNSNNYAIDTSRPTASIVVAGAALSVGETSTVTITFSEAVTGFTNADLTLANGTLTPVSSGDGGITWTATFTPTASVTDATNVITLDNTGVTDAAGNAGSGTTSSNNYAIDTSSPVVASVSLPADGTYVATQNLDLTVNLNENVLVNTAGGTPRIELTLATGGSVYADYLSGSGTSAITFRYTVESGNSDTDGIAVGALSLNGGTIKDAAGNNATLTLNSVSPGAGVLVDAILPALNVVSITSGNPVNTLAKTGDVVTINLTASEPIASPSVTIAGHPAAVSGSASSYTATYTILSTDTEGQVMFNIGFSDLAGNVGTAVTTTSNSSTVTFDKTAPGSPVNLAATKGDTQMILNWTSNSEGDLAGYSIYGGTTANPTTLISTVARSATTFTHTGLTNGTAYYYRIAAMDNAGNESVISGDVTSIPMATQAITFNALIPQTYGNLDFDPGAITSSGLTLSYTSDNTAVATIVSGKVHITGAGTAVITATQPGSAAFYPAADVTQVLTVNKKDITVSLNATAEITRTYNNSTVAALVPANYSIQGLEAGDDVSITGTAAYDNKNSGTNKTIRVNSFILSGVHKDNYNLTTTTSSTVGTITPKNIALTLNAVPAINKVYNGSSAATLVSGNYDLTGVESGDVVSVTGSAVYSDKNVGSGKPVIVTSFAVTGADKDNYTLTTTSASTTGSITAKDILLSLNASPLITKTYDGSAAANLHPGNYSLSGVETGDIVTVTGTATYSDKNAGAGKTVSVNSFTLAGADKANYILTTTSASTTGDITTKGISLSLNASPVITKVYDATSNANLAAGNYILTGVEPSDDVTVSGTASYSDKNTGSGKTVTVSGLALSGAQRGNYHLTTATAATTGNITVKSINVSINPIPAVSKIYDGTTAARLSASNYMLSGVEPGDVVTVSGTAVYNDKNAGPAKGLVVNSFLTSGVDRNNYQLSTISVIATGTIIPKPLDITAVDKTKFQNTVNPDLTVTYTGFIPGEDVSDLTTLPKATTPAVTLSDVGTYPIVPGGGTAENYSFQYVPGKLTIVSGAPTGISLAPSIVYENALPGTVTGNLASTSDVPGAVYTYSLVSGPGDTDNGLFSIKDNQLITLRKLNYEEKAMYKVRVRSTTQYNVSLEKEFLVSIQDVNEPPVFSDIPNTAVCYTTVSQKLIVNGISAGPESGQNVTMNVSSSNPDLFEQLDITDKGVLNYRIKEGRSGVASITVSIKDDGGVLNDGNDSYSQTFELKVNPLPEISIVSNKPAETFKGEEITLTASGGSGYRWRTARGIISGQNSAALNIRPEETTTYRVEAITAEGCVFEKEITITVKENYIKLDANNIISPNGDGKNDNLIIKNLDMYPNNEVKIFDRAGRLVYSKVNYTDEWNGTFQGSPLAEDTYYYVVDFGPGKPKLKGFITIVRD